MWIYGYNMYPARSIHRRATNYKPDAQRVVYNVQHQYCIRYYTKPVSKRINTNYTIHNITYEVGSLWHLYIHIYIYMFSIIIAYIYIYILHKLVWMPFHHFSIHVIRLITGLRSLHWFENVSLVNEIHFSRYFTSSINLRHQRVADISAVL